MEPLYAKLYDKYTKLKAKKFGEIEQLNKEQEHKFLNYMTVSEEVIQHLRDENDSLQAKLNDLLSSSRPSVNDQYNDCHKLLMEEIQKNKELSEEVEKLRKLQKVVSIPEQDTGERRLPNDSSALKNGSDMSNSPVTRSKRKRKRPPESCAEIILDPQDNERTEALREDAENIRRETTSSSIPEGAKQPKCCTVSNGESGDGVNDKATCQCMFQSLIQYTLGMQFSVITQMTGRCISALHESSGYSFSLTWTDNQASEEVELVYTVHSLGTFERIAPEWMREVIKFSSRMCPLFFNRIARFIDVHR